MKITGSNAIAGRSFAVAGGNMGREESAPDITKDEKGSV